MEPGPPKGSLDVRRPADLAFKVSDRVIRTRGRVGSGTTFTMITS